jgi:Uma2 family endonuclease
MASVQPRSSSIDPVAPPSAGPVPLGKRTPKPHEHRFFIDGIDWATYRKIADALEGRHFHMSFDGEGLELMTISELHGWYSRFLCHCIAVLTEELNLPRGSYGDMTLNREDLEQGIEPDESFYITNEAKVRGKKIDLAVDPPPDLGIEIDLTTDSRRRFSIYAKIGVPEIWRYDGKTATIHQRQQEGQYLAVERSRYFAFLTPTDITRFLSQRGQADEGTLIRSFREWVRGQVTKAQ